jgi:hypothetical protein
MSNPETKQPAPRRRRSVPQPVAGAGLFKEWLPLPAFQPLASNVFQTMDSMRWFCRRYHDELIAAGAIAKLAGRTLAHVEKFPATAVEIGRRAAAEPSDT